MREWGRTTTTTRKGPIEIGLMFNMGGSSMCFDLFLKATSIAFGSLNSKLQRNEYAVARVNQNGIAYTKGAFFYFVKRTIYGME